LNLLHNSPTIKESAQVTPGLTPPISGHDRTTVLVSNTTDRTVIGTATEVTTAEDERPIAELPPGEVIPNPQPERKIDLTILDKHIAQTFADSNAELGVCNVPEHEINTGYAKPISQHPSS